jgi:hypothetical protein
MIAKTKISVDLNARLSFLCGAIAGPLFVITVLIEGAARTHYSAFLYPLSSLSIGNMGWAQISNFIITGILLLFFSLGLKQVFNATGSKFRGPLLIGLAGIGLIGAGIFVTDPVFGYPANEPLRLRQFTFHGHLHDLFSMFVFICLPWACFVFRKNFIRTGKQKLAAYSAITGFAMIAFFIAGSIGFKQVAGFVNYAGLFQRLCVFVGLTWVVVLSLNLLKSQTKH